MLLCNASYDTPDFSLKDQVTMAKLVDAYDGDTVACAIPVGKDFYKFKMRLLGIDTPEMRPSRANADRDAEIRAAVATRNRLLQYVLGEDAVDLATKYTRAQVRRMLAASDRLVCLRCHEFGKYGRCLVEIFLAREDVSRGASLNQRLVEEGMACRYDGGKKGAWSDYFCTALLA